ncbi:MAG: hypothetical protein ACKVPZ_09410 [Burkholderiaceae bacterium]
MKLPAQTETMVWSAVAVAAILSTVGFSFGGWQTSRQSLSLGDARAN